MAGDGSEEYGSSMPAAQNVPAPPTPLGRSLSPTCGFAMQSAGQFTQSGLDLRYFVRRQVVASVQGNYGQRPGAAAMIDCLLDRRRALVRNAVGGDPSARQLNDHLMVMTTAHMPAIAIQLVLQVLRSPTHIEMMRQRYCHSLDGNVLLVRARRVQRWPRANRPQPIPLNEGPSAYCRRQRGRPVLPPAVEPRLKP